MTEEEYRNEMFKIAVANNKKFKSIKTNVQLIAGILISTVVITLVALGIAYS